jgi:hypothetical protein
MLGQTEALLCGGKHKGARNFPALKWVRIGRLQFPIRFYSTNMSPRSTADSTIKSGPPFPDKFDGTSLRIAIVHARWNNSIIDALVNGAVKNLKEAGVLEENIVRQSVPGSFELPFACQRCERYIPYPLVSPNLYFTP